VHEVELRVRALLRSKVVEFTKRAILPFPPFPWLVLHDDEPAVRVQEVTWDGQCFVCQMVDDVEAAGTFGDNAEGLKRSYAARGWAVRDEGPVRRVFLFTPPA
jgi:hypothetical protein